VSIGPLITINP